VTTNDLSGPPLRLAVLGDFEGPHTWRWTEFFVRRGHEVHAISFYQPRRDLPGVQLHILRDGGGAGRPAGVSRARSLRRVLPPSLERLIQAWRYKRAGLRGVVDAIAPDVFHAHYVVEHGFYGAVARFHPYVVSGWGSDLYRAPRTPAGRLIAGLTLRQADLVTANDPEMARVAGALGAAPERVKLVRLGVDDLFLADGEAGVNLVTQTDAAPTVLSDRALEPLYNVDVVLRAFARLRADLPSARLLVAGSGSDRGRLEALTGRLGLGDGVRFLGQLRPPDLRAALAAAQVYVSVPGSDSLALSTLEAMAVGAFPVVSDLASQRDWLVDGRNALLVPPRDGERLAAALRRALGEPALRHSAALANRARVRAEGRRDQNLLVMERLYYRLAGRPLAGDGAI
jgi:glycosyltransferase involved in cell wall biosynthesis